MTDGLRDPVILQLTDRGAGFKLDAAHPDVVRHFRPVVDNLLATTVPQPSVRTGEHRVWALQLVDAPGLGPHWCFSVQGRGGVFGAAGTCQFVFASAEGWHPAALWCWCTVRMGERSGVVESAAPPGPLVRPPVDEYGAHLVADVLHGLVRGARRIALGDAPRLAAAVLSRLLPVLPESDVGRYLWSTCLLEKPLSAAQPAVAGRWPHDLRDADPRQAAGVDGWLADGSRSADREVGMTEIRERALDWLVGDVCSAEPEYVAEDDGATMEQLLDRIAEEHLPIAVEDVERLLSTEPGRARLRRRPRTIEPWVVRAPAAARRAIAEAEDRDDRVLRKHLFEALWRLADRDDADNPLGVPQPGRPEPSDGWYDLLAQLVRRGLQTADDRATYLGPMLLPPGRPLGTEEALVEAAPWLTSLGLNREEHPDFFPLPLDRMRNRLAAGQVLGDDDHADLLALGRSPLPLLDGLATHADRARTAVDLVSVLCAFWAQQAERREARSEVEHLARAVARARAQVGADVDPAWLDEFVAGVEARAQDPVLACGATHEGLAVLVADGMTVLPPPVKERCRAVLSNDPTMDAVHRLLLTTDPAPVTAERPGKDRPERAVVGSGAPARRQPGRRHPWQAVEPHHQASGPEPLAAVEDRPRTGRLLVVAVLAALLVTAVVLLVILVLP